MFRNEVVLHSREVVGPSLGGLILERYGFPMCSTVMAAVSLSLAIITTLFFSTRRGDRCHSSSDSTAKDSGIQTSGSFSGSESMRARDEETSLLRKSHSFIRHRCHAINDKLLSTRPPFLPPAERSLDHGDNMREKARSYADSRTAEGAEDGVDWDTEVTDFRGTVNVTAYGACEV